METWHESAPMDLTENTRDESDIAKEKIFLTVAKIAWVKAPVFHDVRIGLASSTLLPCWTITVSIDTGI